MEAKVISLPDRMERQWRVYETGLRTRMKESGIDSTMAEYALARLKPVYMRYSLVRVVEIPAEASPDQAVKIVNDWLSQLGSGLMLEILLRDVELYRLRGEGG